MFFTTGGTWKEFEGTSLKARGLGAAQGPQRVQGSALVGGPGGRSPPEAPEK